MQYQRERRASFSDRSCHLFRPADFISLVPFCAFIFKSRNFSQKDFTMLTTIMQEWKAIKLSNKKKLSNFEDLFNVTSVFHELEKYQSSGNKCTSYNSKFHLKKETKLRNSAAKTTSFPTLFPLN